MNKAIIIIFFNYYNYVYSFIYDSIQKSDKLKEKYAYECIQLYGCSDNCSPNHVLSDTMENCCCAERVKICLEQCDKLRSDFLNNAINDFCLNPDCACPSCSMDF